MGYSQCIQEPWEVFIKNENAEFNDEQEKDPLLV